MDARLFFAMVSNGKRVEHRKNSRLFFELCRVANFPHITDDSRKEVRQYYWDGSLSENDVRVRDARIEKINADAEERYKNQDEVRAILGNVLRGAAHGR
jgi:hypothetical protein